MCICAGRLAVYTIVSTHHGGSPCFHDSGTESRPVRLTHIAFACSRVKTMALGLWTRMNCIVLGSGNNFQVLRIVTLESLIVLPALVFLFFSSQQVIARDRGCQSLCPRLKCQNRKTKAGRTIRVCAPLR